MRLCVCVLTLCLSAQSFVTQTRIIKFEQEVQNTLVKIPIVLGVD